MKVAYPYYGAYPYYSPPMADQLTQLKQAQFQGPVPSQIPGQGQPQANNGVIWVQGESGAKSYLVAPGNAVLLMDSESSTFYLKSADASGMPTLRVFDYQERAAASQQGQAVTIAQGVEYVTRREFEALKAKLDALESASVKEDPENV